MYNIGYYLRQIYWSLVIIRLASRSRFVNKCQMSLDLICDLYKIQYRVLWYVKRLCGIAGKRKITLSLHIHPPISMTTDDRIGPTFDHWHCLCMNQKYNIVIIWDRYILFLEYYKIYPRDSSRSRLTSKRQTSLDHYRLRGSFTKFYLLPHNCVNIKESCMKFTMIEACDLSYTYNKFILVCVLLFCWCANNQTQILDNRNGQKHTITSILCLPVCSLRHDAKYISVELNV